MRWLLLALWLVAVVATVVPLFLPEPAQIELVVADSTFGQDLTGAVATITDQRRGTALSQPVTSQGGSQRVWIDRIQSGPQSLKVQIQGFRPATTEFLAAPLELTRQEVALESLHTRVLVEVVDGRTGDPLREARLDQPPASPRSIETGYELLLPEGDYQLAGEAPGYCRGERTLATAPGQTIRLQLPLSPVLTAGEAARLILDWGENPRDLDAHTLLELSDAEVSKPHAYFGHKQVESDAGTLLAELDIDYLHSEGFETTTLYNSSPSTYRYFVHHYAGSGSLAESQAAVTVSTRGCKDQSYSIPTDCVGKFWEVVDIKVTPSAVDIIERNTCSQEPIRRWARGQK